MKHAVLIEEMQVDDRHQLHITVPADMGQHFKVIVLPVESAQSTDLQDRQMMARLMDESGFFRTVLNSLEEDVWNEL